MKNQRDDMSGDLHAHGSRKLVAAEFVANNQKNRNRQLHQHLDDHYDHDHHHHHNHQEWY
jgi:hypothetical protein